MNDRRKFAREKISSLAVSFDLIELTRTVRLAVRGKAGDGDGKRD